MTPAPAPMAKHRRWGRARRYLAGSVSGKLGLALVVTLVLASLLAPLLAPHDPYEQHARFRLLGPSLYFPFGTDEFGRDIFSRVLYGARISLQVGVASVAIALLAGGLLGLVAGFRGGWVDAVIGRVLDVIFAFPEILLALALLAVLGPRLRNLVLAIGIVYTPAFARIVRGPILAARTHEYVEASRVSGASDVRILFRHLLPNVTTPVMVQISIALSFAILSEAALSFLGLGSQPPEPSWGAMLSGGRRFVEIAPWTAIFPGLAIMLAVLGFNLLGDWLRDLLDPRTTR